MAEESLPLAECCILVWRHLDGEARAHDALTAKVRELGGKVAPKLTRKVTQVIYLRKFQPTPKQKSAEDAELRDIYNWLSKLAPLALVVDPLWLQDTAEAGTRAKASKYVVRRPAEPTFLPSPNKTGLAAAKRKRKSYARPRELVDLRDLDDALFSSSQQIRNLDGPPGEVHNACRSSVDPPLPDRQDLKGEQQGRPKPALATAAPLAVSRKALTSNKPHAPKQQQPSHKQEADLKRPMRQLPLNFAVISKKPAQVPAVGDGARPDGSTTAGTAAVGQQQQQPIAVAAQGEQPARDTSASIRDEGAPGSNHPIPKASNRPISEEIPKQSSVVPELLRPSQPPPELPQQREAQPSRQAASETGPVPPQSASIPNARYPALPCAVVSAVGGEPSRPRQAAPSGVRARHSLGSVAPAFTNAADAGGEAGGSCAKAATVATARALHARRASALPPRPPTLCRVAGADGGGDGAAPAVTAAPPASAAVPSGARQEAVTEGRIQNPDSAAARATTSRATQQGSARRGSWSLSGTPLAPALTNGKSTPLHTPKGWTPGALVMPRLKSQGSALSAATVPTSSAPMAVDSEKAPLELKVTGAAKAAQHGKGPTGAACALALAEAAEAVIGSFHNSPALCRRQESGANGPGGVGQGQHCVPGNAKPTEGDIAPASALVSASVRRSTRVRGLLPPTPPPAYISAAAAPAPTRNQVPETGRGSVVTENQNGRAKTASLAGGVVVRPAGANAALGTPLVLGATGSADAAKHAQVPQSGSVDNPIVIPDSVATGTDTGCRPQKRVRAVWRGPLALSPVVHGNTPGAGPLPTAEPEPVAARQGQASSGAAAPAARRGPAVGVPSAEATNAAPTPALGRRFSARLAGSSPLLSVPPHGQPGEAWRAGAEADESAAQPPVLLQQHLSGDAKNESLQQNVLVECQPSQKKLRRELASLIEGVFPEDERSTAAGCTPAAIRKTRRRNQAAAGEDGGDTDGQLLQQQQSPPAIAMQAHQQRDGSASKLVFAFPSPALCTRSRSRAAVPTPCILGGAAAQPQLTRTDPAGASTRHTADDKCRAGPDGRHDDFAAQRLPQPQERPEQSPPCVNAAGKSEIAGRQPPGAAAASSAEAQAQTPGAWERPGSVTRSRRRALEADMASAAQAPPSTAGKGKGTAFTRAAALLEAAAEAPPYVKATAAHGQQLLPGAGSCAGPAGPAALPPRPPRHAPAGGRAAGSAAGPSAPVMPCPLESTPRGPAGATEAAGGAAPASKPSRASARKRSRDTPANDTPAEEAGLGNLKGAAGVVSRSAPCESVERLIIAASSCAVAPANATSTSVSTIATIDKAAGPVTAPCPAVGPLSRSRLRKRKQENGPTPGATRDGAVPCGGNSVLDRSVVPDTSASDLPAQKRRRTLQGSEATTSNRGGSTATSAGAVNREEGRPDAADRPQVKAEGAPVQKSAQPVSAPSAPASACRSRPCGGAPASGAAGAGPRSLLQGIFRSVTLAVTASASAGNGVLKSASTFLGTGAGKSTRLANGTCTGPGCGSVLEPLQTGTAEGSSAPALGQYPRGKDHPMRAGHHYLAHTRVGKETEAATEAAVKQLGHARLCTAGYEHGHITHLIVGDAECRTIKVLVGIANGAFLVKPSWVEASIAAGHWVPEEQHLVEGPFAATANAVRAQLKVQQQQQQQLQQQQRQPNVNAAAGPAAPPPASAGVLAKPLTGRMLAILNPQCQGRGLSDLQKRKADLEKLVGALGGRIVPLRSARLLIAVQGSTSSAERQKVPVASEDWLKRLAETHIWQEPS